MRKKILFFLSNLDGGGAQRTIVNVLRHLDREKFAPKLVLLDYNLNHPYVPLVPDDVPIININRRGRFAVIKITNLIKQEEPEVVFSTLQQVNITVSIAHLLSRTSAKLILRETTHRSRNSMKNISFMLSKWSYRYCNQIIALSNGVAEEMKELYELKDEKIRVVYNPVEISTIQREVDRIEKESQNQMNLIACGRLVPLKNFNLLIEALGEVNKNFQNWTLNILGEGPERNNLTRLAENFKINDKINILGFKENPYSYMANSDLLILTSKWEGFGHVIVESMAVGTPVMATNCPHGPKEILKDGEFGWLVKNNDVNALSKELLEILSDPLSIQIMGEKAKKRALDFDVSKVIREYEEIIVGNL